MTNYEIIQQLEYIKTSTNQKIDMLINKLKVEDTSSPKKSNITISANKDNSRNMGVKQGWTEMTGNQIEMPNIIM